MERAAMRAKTVLACAAVAVGGLGAAARADVLSGPIVDVAEGFSFAWGTPVALETFWSIRTDTTGWIYGSDWGTTVEFYVAGPVDPLTVADASGFAYSSGVSSFSVGDTIFFRGVTGYYGAWVVRGMEPDAKPGPPNAYMSGTWYYQDDGSASFPPDPSFTPLGDLPGGPILNFARGISADGTVVAGTSDSAAGLEAYRWTASGGLVGLGDLAGGSVVSSGRAISGDGAVVVGQGSLSVGDGAFRWSGGVMEALGDLPGGTFFSDALGVSADGSVVVGFGTSGAGQAAFMWTAQDGMLELGDLPGGAFFSRANGVSADGSVIVGEGTSASGREAFRWAQMEGMVGLGDLAGGLISSTANAVSEDGSTIVGGSGSASSGDTALEAFRWTAADGMVGLGDLPGGSFASFARGVNADGTVVVGSANIEPGPFASEAFVWTAETGMVNVREHLVSQGVTGLEGWTLSIAFGVSADGRIVVGDGLNPQGDFEGWIANLGVLGAPGCAADFNADDQLSVADFSAFRAAYLAGDMAADMTGDGSLSVADFSAFRTAYLAGCP